MNSYSTRGGIVGWTVRVISPSRSRPRSVQGEASAAEIPSIARRSSLGRRHPSPRTDTMSTLHLCAHAPEHVPWSPGSVRWCARPSASVTWMCLLARRSRVTDNRAPVTIGDHLLTLALDRPPSGVTPIDKEHTRMATENWTFDPVHSSVNFWVRHLMVSGVHGSFTKWSGTLAFDEQAPQERPDRGRDRRVEHRHEGSGAG